jgi:hypothetical protein
MLEKITKYILDHQDFFSVLCTFLLTEFISRKVPTKKRSSFFSIFGKYFSNNKNLKTFGNLFYILSKFLFKVSDTISKVVPDEKSNSK